MICSNHLCETYAKRLHLSSQKEAEAWQICLSSLTQFCDGLVLGKAEIRCHD